MNEEHTLGSLKVLEKWVFLGFWWMFRDWSISSIDWSTESLDFRCPTTKTHNDVTRDFVITHFLETHSLTLVFMVIHSNKNSRQNQKELERDVY